MQRFLVLVLVLFLSAGCVQLTEDQQNRVSEASAKVVSIEARIGKLVPVLDRLCKNIADVVEKVARGELPKEEGDRLIALYKAQKEPVEMEIKAGIEEVKILAKTVEAIRDSGVPWYQQLWLLLPSILGGVVAYNRNSKLGAANKIMGVLARAGNAADGFGGHVVDEVAGTPGVTREMTDAVWRAATDREI